MTKHRNATPVGGEFFPVIFSFTRTKIGTDDSDRESRTHWNKIKWRRI